MTKGTVDPYLSLDALLASLAYWTLSRQLMRWAPEHSRTLEQSHLSNNNYNFQYNYNSCNSKITEISLIMIILNVNIIHMLIQ